MSLTPPCCLVPVCLPQQQPPPPRALFLPLMPSTIYVVVALHLEAVALLLLLPLLAPRLARKEKPLIRHLLTDRVGYVRAGLRKRDLSA